MSVRLQTWFPFELQIAINGREWLRRSLDAAGCKYLKQGNKFLDIADYPLAQHLLDTQLDTQWKEMLAAFLPEVFPTMPQTLSRAPNLWADDNSVKHYNEQNVLRVEMTMNRPDRFEVFRHKEGRQDAPKQRLPLRKGVVDIPLRAQVAADVNKRFTAHLATLKDETPVREVFAEFRAQMHEGRRVRVLDPLGKDLALLQAIADPALGISGITNKALRGALVGTPWANGKKDKALSARINRHFRLLCDHDVIRKLPNQRKYQLTDKGRRFTSVVNVLLGASTQQLLDMAA